MISRAKVSLYTPFATRRSPVQQNHRNVVQFTHPIGAANPRPPHKPVADLAESGPRHLQTHNSDPDSSGSFARCCCCAKSMVGWPEDASHAINQCGKRNCRQAHWDGALRVSLTPNPLKIKATPSLLAKTERPGI
jgi:hypothetical protein